MQSIKNMGKIAIVTLVSLSPYSQSRFHNTLKGDRENPEDYENRTWKERLHKDEKGNVFIPPMAFKNCITEAAQFLSIQIPGKGKATYTKHFEAGIMVLDPVFLKFPKSGLPIKALDVRGDWIFTPSGGQRGSSSSRVMRCYPMIDDWTGTVEFFVIDDTITEAVFKRHLEQAGSLIGVGRFRVRNRGYYGRFGIEQFKWQDMTGVAA